MYFERTTDAAVVKRIITHPKVYPWISDDNSPAPEEFEPTIHPAILHLLCIEGKECIGLWTFIPHTSACWEVHTYLLPKHGMKRGRQAARMALDVVWANSTCRRIFANVPDFNPLALKFALDVGFVEFGYNPASLLKNGKLWGQHLMGISKPERDSGLAVPTLVEEGVLCPQP